MCVLKTRGALACSVVLGKLDIAVLFANAKWRKLASRAEQIITTNQLRCDVRTLQMENR